MAITKTASGEAEDAPTANAALERAAALAERMPLVHYPASLAFDDWADEAHRWPALRSDEARTNTPSPPDDPFKRLRRRHAFAYAGPSCYFREDAIGTLLLYFKPGAPDGKTGGVTRFDSGSLEPSTRTGLPVL
jgi:hypothetical protein